MAGERTVRGGATPSARPRRRLTVGEIHQLITLMKNSDIDEITIEHGDNLRLTLRKPAPIATPAVVAPHASADGATSTADAQKAEKPKRRDGAAVKSPLVGVYRASGKGKPFVKVGDTVRQGQIVAAIESLNVLNEVEAPSAGKVAALFVEDGQAVEYGWPLLRIEPKRE